MTCCFAPQTSAGDTTFCSPPFSSAGESNPTGCQDPNFEQSLAIPLCGSRSLSLLYQGETIHGSIKNRGFISPFLKLDSHGRSCSGHTVVDQPLPICGNSREVQDKEDYDDLLSHCFGTGQWATALLCWDWQQQKILHCCSAALTWEAKLFECSCVN